MNHFDALLGAILTLFFLGYLSCALLKPEWFDA